MHFQTVQARESSSFLPVARRLPIALVEGRGSRVWDVEGREYVDLTAGWGVTAIGHCHPVLVEAISRQAGRLIQMTAAVYTLPQLDLSERLASLTPEPLTRSFFVTSGTEAVEGAIKLAHRATGRAKFVSTEGSFHGRSLGSLSLIGRPRHRSPYEKILAASDRVPYGDLAAMCAAVDTETAAVVVEPIQGEGGVIVPPAGYLRGLRSRCDETGALLVFDEIQTGIGRTGRWFGLEHDDVVPDVITLGKGLGGGFPIAAFLTTEAVAKTVSVGDHGGTYAGHPLGCAASHAVLGVIAEEGLVERAAELGARVRERLESFAAERPDLASAVRGRGLLLGLELCGAQLGADLQARALERGVLVDVTAGRVVRLFPALNVPEGDLWPALEAVLDLIRD